MKQLIAANWKMNKDSKDADYFFKEFRKHFKNASSEVLICPPFTLLRQFGLSIKNSGIKLGAQNMHYEEKWAFTGEISPLMLKGAGCEYVILGHSERRHFFNEGNELINKKIKSALKHKLKPILCVGETLEQRENNQTKGIIMEQLDCLKSIKANEAEKITVAYEPVWAIGTGNNATPEQAEEVHSFIRELLSKICNQQNSRKIRIIYGGSVKPENAKELLSMKDINGALVGGASLDAKSFSEICNLSFKAL